MQGASSVGQVLIELSRIEIAENVLRVLLARRVLIELSRIEINISNLGGFQIGRVLIELSRIEIHNQDSEQP